MFSTYSDSGTLLTSGTSFLGMPAGYTIQDTVTAPDGTAYGLATQTTGESSQLLLFQYTQNGTVQPWRVLTDHGFGPHTSQLTTDSDGNVYVASHIAGIQDRADVWLGKYSPDNKLLGSRILGSVNTDIVHNMAIGEDGAVYLAGYTEGQLAVTAERDGDGDAWVAKVDLTSASNPIHWVSHIHTDQADAAWGVAVSDDSVYVTGQTDGWLGQTYEGDISSWTGDVNHYQHAYYGDRSFFGGTYRGEGDAFISQLDLSTGTVNWTRLLGTGTEDIGLGVVADGLGGAYIVGQTQSQLGSAYSNERHAGGVDIFAARYNSEGALTWKEQWGSTGDDLLGDIAVNDQGELFLLGSTTGDFPDANQGNQDAWIMKVA